MVYKASARAARTATGARAYKPILKAANGKSRVLHQAGGREQGLTFPTRGDAIACATRMLALCRDEVKVRAAKYGPRSAVAIKCLQQEYELYGGTGDVFTA